jgi:plasmid replication initiation protein
VIVLSQFHHSGLQPAGAILRGTCPDLIVSKQKLKQAERIQLVRQNREQATQTLCFNSRPFVLCGLPVRRLPKDQLLYERRNGRFVLQVTGHPEFGVPFGQDRLVPIFLATLAVQQKSQTIRFRTAAEMLETFGMQTGGKEYRRLVGAFERVFGATIFFGTDALRVSAKVVPRGTPEKRPMRDTSKPANGIRQDKVVITHVRVSRQRKTWENVVTIGYADDTWAEDMAPQGCDQSADPAAGMRGRR